MGTYMNVVLKDNSEDNIQRCNAEIKAMGYETVMVEGVEFGAFVTMAQLTEDARYMNEDPEGLKDWPHQPRPLKPMTLSNNFPWMKLGGCQIKLSSAEVEVLRDALFIAEWIRVNNEMINPRESSNYRVSFVQTYIYEPV